MSGGDFGVPYLFGAVSPAWSTTRAMLNDSGDMRDAHHEFNRHAPIEMVMNFPVHTFNRPRIEF